MGADSDGRVDELRRELALARNVVDHVSAMLAYWDSEQRCRFANRAYVRWFGVSPEQLIGKHIRELLGPIYPLNLPYIEGVLRGEPQEFEREIADPAGGQPRFSQASYVPDIVDGQVRGFFALVADVTELKRTEERLRLSEAKFSGIISISVDGIISVDESQRITVFNRGAERIFGYAQAEVVGGPLEVLLPARLRAAHRQHVEGFAASDSAARNMGERNTTLAGLRKSGDEFPLEASISKLDLGGRRLFTVLLRDVSERKQIEKEQRILAEAGAVLASSLDYKDTLTSVGRLIVGQLADLCVIDMLDDHGELQRLVVVHADPAKAELCEELVRLPIDRQHRITRGALEAQGPFIVNDVDAIFIESRAQEGEHRRLVRALDPRSVAVVPISSRQRVLGALLVGASHRGAYGAREILFLEELARRAAFAIENSQLYRAARRATEARDEVLGVVAHDLRNPLTSIGLTAKLMQQQLEQPKIEDVTENLARIERSLGRIDRLIRDLLDITALDAGQLSVERARVSSKTLVADALEAQKLLTTSRSLTLLSELDEALPDVLGDRDRLLQVLENLIGNAVKFTPPGGSITVGAANRGAEVLFHVADSGAGIPAESVPHVFDRFWRSREAQRSGAGLGLSISRGLVVAQGGRIWVESTPGRGTTFSFTIPAAPEPPK